MTRPRNSAFAGTAAFPLHTLVQVLRLALVLVVFAWIAAWLTGVDADASAARVASATHQVDDASPIQLGGVHPIAVLAGPPASSLVPRD